MPPRLRLRSRNERDVASFAPFARESPATASALAKHANGAKSVLQVHFMFF
jgi:hypothetical protein